MAGELNLDCEKPSLERAELLDDFFQAADALREAGIDPIKILKELEDSKKETATPEEVGRIMDHIRKNC